MLRKSHLVTLPALVASLFLLTGCPPPPEHTQWKRASTSEEGVLAAMKAMHITWRKVGASQHFSVELANDQQALPDSNFIFSGQKIRNR